VRAPVVLHAISSFDDTTIDYSAPAIVNGLKKCISGAESLRKEITNSPDFWSIMHRLHQHNDEAESIFKLLHFISSSQPMGVTADNYESAIELANDFASAASIGALQEQRKDAARRGGKPLKQAKPQ
jgi:brefeldin A-resistance guanine nucleotide exchange factor 1